MPGIVAMTEWMRLALSTVSRSLGRKQQLVLSHSKEKVRTKVAR